MICPICRDQLEQEKPENFDENTISLGYKCPRCTTSLTIFVEIKPIVKEKTKSS